MSLRRRSATPFERHLDEALVAAGFEFDGEHDLYLLSAPDILGVFEVRRGKWFKRAEGEFLLALTVTSRLLADALDQPFGPATPSWDAHWYFNPTYPDAPRAMPVWEQVAGSGPTWQRQDADLNRRIIPLLRQHLSDAQLVRCWRDHPDHWHEARLRRLTYRALLEPAIGSSNEDTVGLLRRYLARRPDAPGLKGFEGALEKLGLQARRT